MTTRARALRVFIEEQGHGKADFCRCRFAYRHLICPSFFSKESREKLGYCLDRTILSNMTLNQPAALEGWNLEAAFSRPLPLAGTNLTSPFVLVRVSESWSSLSTQNKKAANARGTFDHQQPRSGKGRERRLVNKQRVINRTR